MFDIDTGMLKDQHPRFTMADTTQDPKRVVQAGYDKIAKTYLQWTSGKLTPRLDYLKEVLSRLKDASKATVLELGCGAGIPCTQLLAAQCAHVVANDISDAQIQLARANVPATKAEFVSGDMAELEFDVSTYDAVVGFYSIIHLPREQQREMMLRIWKWLKPGGYFLCNLGASDLPGSTNDWLGSKMYWSSFDADKNLLMVKDIGFKIEKNEIIEDDEDGRRVPFLWVLARKDRF